jgi:hypothetical protein
MIANFRKSIFSFWLVFDLRLLILLNYLNSRTPYKSILELLYLFLVLWFRKWFQVIANSSKSIFSFWLVFDLRLLILLNYLISRTPYKSISELLYLFPVLWFRKWFQVIANSSKSIFSFWLVFDLRLLILLNYLILRTPYKSILGRLCLFRVLWFRKWFQMIANSRKSIFSFWLVFALRLLILLNYNCTRREM